MQTVMVTGHVGLVSATLLFFTTSSDLRQKSTNVCNVLQNHSPDVADIFRRFFFISSQCDVDKRSFSESSEG